MSDAAALKRTISALTEALQGGRDLDELIWRHVAEPEERRKPPPAFTTSLDAAETLKPQGWRLSLRDNGEGGWEAEVYWSASDGAMIWRSGQARTGPLALAIACLRASVAFVR